MSLELFTSIGLSERKAQETLKNPTVSNFLEKIITEAKGHVDNGIGKTEGTLLYHIATRLKPQCRQHMPLIVKHVCNGNIKSELQMSAALEYLLTHTVSGIKEEKFLKACGAGIEVTPEQIEQTVSEVIEKFKTDIISERYSYNMGRLMAVVRQLLEWADGGGVKHEVDLQILELLGPKTAEELQPKKKGEKTKKVVKKPLENGVKEAPVATEESEGAETVEELMRRKVHFHKPGENFKTEGYVTTPNTIKLMQKHLKETGGKVVTRFPPEPNGILHIGHAKAINVNFGYAKAFDGYCYLRYDDTNPEKEEEKYFKAILEMVEWLGYKPYKVTHSSDYFDQLYNLAVDLIKSGNGYVCHQRADEMKGYNPPPSPWRDRPIEESLQLFEDMKNGKFGEGEATLRMKTTLEEGKMDPVAYRIKFIPHHRTGNKWCIYPTYDYTHCLCDSIENISHSLCTKEFQSRRSSYYWLCNILDIYCPVQWEYGRLNFNYTVVSKRKLKELIEEKIVRDWDDPRLFTLTALRRRGFPAEAINAFVAKMGLTTARVTVDPQMLDASVRDVLNYTAPRVMVVLEPIKVRINNWSDNDWPKQLSVPDFPVEPEKGSHVVAFDSILYIEQSDVREEADKQFRRLTLKQNVGLKHVGCVLEVKDIVKNSAGQVTELIVNCHRLSEKNKPKAFIHWVAKPIKVEVRLYDTLFIHKNPEDLNEVPGGFVTDCNKDSLEIISEACADCSVVGAKVYDKFQFERIGYFSVDIDSTPKKLVFNRTVLLKEDVSKNV